LDIRFGMMKKFLLLFVFFINLLFSQSPKADFFIAKDLSEFEILNRYQQKISSAEKQKLAEYTPWKIINRNTILGDQFTQAMQVEYNGISFYFVLVDEGGFKGNPKMFYEIFGNCTIINDEINVRKEKAILFREVPFSNKSKIPRTYMELDLHLNRLFKKGQSYFVKNLQTNKYGWIRINSASAIEIAPKEKQKTKSEFNSVLIEQVETKVDEINSVYTQLFNYLNLEYAKNKIAPLWKISSDEKNIIISLENAKSGKLKRSTSYFVNDLENIFANERVFINSTANSITITLNDEN